jgi:hypothetical protein
VEWKEILSYRRISCPSCKLIVDVILANSSMFCFKLLVFCFHQCSPHQLSLSSLSQTMYLVRTTKVIEIG